MGTVGRRSVLADFVLCIKAAKAKIVKQERENKISEQGVRYRQMTSSRRVNHCAGWMDNRLWNRLTLSRKAAWRSTAAWRRCVGRWLIFKRRRRRQLLLLQQILQILLIWHFTCYSGHFTPFHDNDDDDDITIQLQLRWRRRWRYQQQLLQLLYLPNTSLTWFRKYCLLFKPLYITLLWWWLMTMTTQRRLQLWQLHQQQQEQLQLQRRRRRRRSRQSVSDGACKERIKSPSVASLAFVRGRNRTRT